MISPRSTTEGDVLSEFLHHFFVRYTCAGLLFAVSNFVSVAEACY